MKRESIADTIIRTLEDALEEARPETVARLGGPDMMHRMLLAGLSGAFGYHAEIGNKKAGRAAALIDQFDEAYKLARKAECDAMAKSRDDE